MASPKLKRFFVATAPGLERCLERELQALRVPGRLEALPGGVEVLGPPESLWKTVLQSRVAQHVRQHLGEPFHAPDVESLDRGLRRLAWAEHCRPGSRGRLEAPQLKVSSDKSRLYHTGLVEERIAAAIAAVPSPEAPVKRTARKGPPPLLHVSVRHDACRVSADMSGPLHMRGQRKSVGETPLRETLAAACVLASPLLRALSEAAHRDEELVLWDPFCGSGGLILEALGIAMGQPPGSAKRDYPFTALSEHDPTAYAELTRSIEVEPHPALSRLIVLGSDRSAEQIENAKKNLRRFTRRSWSTDDKDAPEAKQESAELPCRVDLVEGSIYDMAKGLGNRPTLILTNAPYGFRGVTGEEREGPAAAGPAAAESYLELRRALLRRGADVRGAYCLVAGSQDFREITGLEWTQELKFLNSGHWVELLAWSRGAGPSSPDRPRPRPRQGQGRRR